MPTRLDQIGVGTEQQPTSFTDQQLSPTPLKPGEALFETAKRAVGRMTKEREVQSGLQDVYAARTAQAAKGFGDTANIAVAEREMLQSSFPQDGETYDRRLTKEQSLNQTFTTIRQRLQGVLAKPDQQTLAGYSKSGPRFELDKTIQSQKKQAANDLQRLDQTEALYQQMYQEAAKKMPPIGSVSKGSGGVTPSGMRYTVEE